MQNQDDIFARASLPAGRLRVKPPPGAPKDISGCAIAGICCTDGRRISSDQIVQSVATMRERGNGLGGGFAAYGIYPDHADCYSFHVTYDSEEARRQTEEYLRQSFRVVHQEEIPTRPVAVIRDRPVFQRYFVLPTEASRQRHYDLDDDDLVVMATLHVNVRIDGAFVFSSGRNCGVFKGVGYPEDIAEFFRLEQYRAYLWTAHGRFPTNTTGWWGGAHPFGILDWSVVHNGEISSYGTNRRYLANFGYFCALQTDTEVVAYLFDLLVRKHRLPVETACMAFAPPFWSEIERMDDARRRLARAVRLTYAPALLNGPFSIVVGFTGGMIALNDRIKLRPMTAATGDRRVYVASEESAIRAVCPHPQRVWQLGPGEPLVVSVEGIPSKYLTGGQREHEAVAAAT